jgi:hypothetical protein
MTHVINIGRLSIRLRGIARPVAEAALDGLGQELTRRLARAPLSVMPTNDIFRIDMRGLNVADPRDAAALRDAIALRLVSGLTESRPRAAEGKP